MGLTSDLVVVVRKVWMMRDRQIVRAIYTFLGTGAHNK